MCLVLQGYGLPGHPSPEDIRSFHQHLGYSPTIHGWDMPASSRSLQGYSPTNPLRAGFNGWDMAPSLRAPQGYSPTDPPFDGDDDDDDVYYRDQY